MRWGLDAMAAGGAWRQGGLALILALILAVPLGCGGASEDAATSVPSPPSVSAEEPREGEPLAVAASTTLAAPPFDIDAYLASLPEGAIAFNAPETIEVETPVRLRLVVQPGVSEPQIAVEHAASATPSEQGPVQTATTLLAPELEARLVSSTLQVVALDPERQSVSASLPTEWRWDITAKQGGEQALALSLFAIPPDQGSPRRVKTFERAIQVQVPFGKRVAGLVGNNLEWLWTLIVAPVGGWLYARWRRRRQEGSPDA